jgi:tetratricopeptide (TPR) repeat protein
MTAPSARRQAPASAQQADAGGEAIPALLAAGLGHARDGKPEAAANAFNQILSIDGDNLDALNNLGVLHAIGGRFTEAVRCFEKALVAAPEDAELRRNLVKAYFYVGLNRMDARDYAGALADYRKLIGLDPNHAAGRVNLCNMLAATGVKAEIGDFAPGLSADALGTHVLVACMPKSGSSFLTTALRALTGWPQNFMTPRSVPPGPCRPDLRRSVPATTCRR